MDARYGKLGSHVMQRRLIINNANSFFDGVLDQQDKLNLNRNQLKFLCRVLMDGGSDTSSSMILAFLHAMIKYPEVQNRAQQQIDFVMGEERSPV